LSQEARVICPECKCKVADWAEHLAGHVDLARTREDALRARINALRGDLEDAAGSLEWIATQQANDLVSEMRQYARSRAQVARHAALRGGKEPT